MYLPAPIESGVPGDVFLHLNRINCSRMVETAHLGIMPLMISTRVSGSHRPGRPRASPKRRRSRLGACEGHVSRRHQRPECYIQAS